MSRWNLGFLAVVFFALDSALPQESGWLDLTDLYPRERVRAPNSASSSCSGGGDFNRALEATVTLISLDKTSYAIGEEVTFEVKIHNSGRDTIEFPWTPHLGDLEPLVSSSYSYLQATTVLTFTEPDSNRSFSIFAYSYGALDVSGTVRRIPPGAWLFVRARQTLEAFEDWWWTKIRDSAPLNVKASASLMLQNATYSPPGPNTPAIDHFSCIPLGTKRGPPSDVALFPRASR